MCTLAMQAGKLTVRPYMPLVKESCIREGFFEPEQFQSVQRHLLADPHVTMTKRRYEGRRSST